MTLACLPQWAVLDIRFAISFRYIPESTNLILLHSESCSFAGKQHYETDICALPERLFQHTCLLPFLLIGDCVRIQNQVVPLPTKWDKTGIVEVRQFHQYVVCVDKYGRVTLRNRKFPRKYLPVIPRSPCYQDDQHHTRPTPQISWTRCVSEVILHHKLSQFSQRPSQLQHHNDQVRLGHTIPPIPRALRNLLSHSSRGCLIELNWCPPFHPLYESAAARNWPSDLNTFQCAYLFLRHWSTKSVFFVPEKIWGRARLCMSCTLLSTHVVCTRYVSFPRIV